MDERGLAQRLTRGAQAQAFQHITRVVIQVGGVSLFTAAWGLHLYGEWLILTAVPTYVAFSDLGFGTAAVNEMIIAVGRGDRARSLAVFQAISWMMLAVGAVLALALPGALAALPVTKLLNLSIIHESTAAAIIVILTFDALLALFAPLLYAGFACEGRYGEGTFALAAITFVEFCALAAMILAGGGPSLVAGAMLLARLLGTIATYAAMRRRAPWLHFGKPPAARALLRRLLTPALASGAFPVAFALNLQGMVLMIGVAVGPVSAAVFSTLRTLSRSVIQLLASVNSVISPEISKAFGAGDASLLRSIHRRGCQVALWLSTIVVALLAVFGRPIVHLWTSGRVGTGGALLYLLLLVALIDIFWYTSAAVLIATNRHQRVAVDYVIACVVTVPIAYVLLKAIGLSGPALALVLLELFMAVAVIRRALPAAHDTLGGLIRAVRTPPFFVLRGSRGIVTKPPATR